MSTLLRQEIKIMGAGRTDTGVHARCMYAHFDFDGEMRPDLVHKLNSFLEKTIQVYFIFPVADDFHARFDAKQRTYQYQIHLEGSPFLLDSHWIIKQEIPVVERMQKAANFLLEVDDFSSFAKLHSDNKTNICKVNKAKWERVGEKELHFYIRADRFLRNMVRAIVGTLVRVGQDKISLEEFKETILNKDRIFAQNTAPAHGLYLFDIQYDFEGDK